MFLIKPYKNDAPFKNNSFNIALQLLSHFLFLNLRNYPLGIYNNRIINFRDLN
ncbi:hypothetical protein L313_1700 [Acinetobacter haemolyticus CIP 64.3 = MTCC 9819]|nr:hypothetical protein L313_1700 [Acinetobacter haemolyticus CIP 64.3 = MTCC 9819]